MKISIIKLGKIILFPIIAAVHQNGRNDIMNSLLNLVCLATTMLVDACEFYWILPGKCQMTPPNSIKRKRVDMTNGLLKEVVSAENAPKAIDSYSAGIKAEHFLFASGQLGLDRDCANLAMSLVTGQD